MRIYLDVETVPKQPEQKAKDEIAKNITAPGQMKKAETIADWHSGAGKYAGEKDAAIESAYRSGSFDGGSGELISIAWAIGDGDIQSCYRSLDQDEGSMIRDFIDKLNVHLAGVQHTGKPFFVGHNIVFDLKFIFRRCVVLGINPEFPLPFRGRHDSDYYCTMAAWSDFKERISQNNLCKALGIEEKPDDIDGSKVWDFVKSGDVKRVNEYNEYDVETVRKIYKKINFTNPRVTA